VLYQIWEFLLYRVSLRDFESHSSCSFKSHSNCQCTASILGITGSMKIGQYCVHSWNTWVSIWNLVILQANHGIRDSKGLGSCSITTDSIYWQYTASTVKWSDLCLFLRYLGCHLINEGFCETRQLLETLKAMVVAVASLAVTVSMLAEYWESLTVQQIGQYCDQYWSTWISIWNWRVYKLRIILGSIWTMVIAVSRLLWLPVL
jgi:hypothetical protein